MEEADGYLLVPKEFIEGYENGDINNMHIVNCMQKSDGTWSVTWACRCGQVKRKGKLWSNCNSSEIIKRATTLRNRVAEIENAGAETVCGRCVATLYTDGE